MVHWLKTLSNETTRTKLGHRFEAATEEVFNVLPWSFVVGFARFLSVNTGTIWLQALHWTVSGLLFGYLASRFLLRPEIPVFITRDRPWKRATQSIINLMLCAAAFLIVMGVLNTLVSEIALYRFGQPAQ